MNQQSNLSFTQNGTEPSISGLPGQIQADIQGEISGQIVVGSHVLQIGSIHGGVVNINSDEQPSFKVRSLPVLLRPRPFLNLIGREAEIKTAIEVLQASPPLEICGEEGIGKTSVLRHLAHRPEIGLLFPDGVIYLSARSKSVSDLLQFLFDAFYDSSALIKPTDIQIRHALQDKRAVVLLDDTKLTRNELEELMDVLPNSTFLLASHKQHLWGEGKSIVLQGFTAEQAIALLENNLGRSLELEEKSAARALCKLLNGHPLKLLQCLASVKQGTSSLTEIAHQYYSKSKLQHLPESTQTTVNFTKEECRVLATLATLGDIGLIAQQVAAIAQLPDAAKTLQTLYQRNVIRFDGERYSINTSFAQSLKRSWNLKPWIKRTLDYFTTFAEQSKANPERILKEADAVIHLLSEAATAELWAEILQLEQLVETLFALNKYWGFWEKVLQLGLQAARQTGQQNTEAFILHQIGTRAICLGDRNAAQSALKQAVQIRESIGDRVGAAISRHNLRILWAVIAGSAAVVMSVAQATATPVVTGVVSSASNLSATVGKTSIGAAAATTTSFGTATLLKVGATAALLATGTLISVNLIDHTQPITVTSPEPSRTTTVATPLQSQPASPLPSQSTALQQPQLINPQQSPSPQQPANPQPANLQPSQSVSSQPSQSVNQPSYSSISQQQSQSTSPSQSTQQQPSQPVNQQQSQSISPQQPQPINPQPIQSQSPIDPCSQALQRFGVSRGQQQQTSEQALGEINSHLQDHDLRPLSPEQMQEFCAKAQPQ